MIWKWMRDALEAPLIDDDSGTLIHVVWRNGRLIDLTGAPWTQVGSVTQVPAVDGLPAGARLFSGANHYESAAAVSPVAVASFAGCAIVVPTANDLINTTMILNGGFSAPSSGWELVANETGAVRWISAQTVTDAPLVAGQPNVICFGQDSSIASQYMKVNMRPLARSTGSVLVPLPAQPLKIGTHFDNVLGFDGTIHEIWISSSLPGGLSAAFYGPELWDEYFAYLTQRAFARMRTPVASASQVVFQATCNLHLASVGQLLEIVATSNAAFAPAVPTGAIRAGQTFTLRIKNTSGGALTFSGFPASFKLAAWTSPANGFSRSITFQFDGTSWIEVGRTPADVPN
jgi:hypothetical protein